MDTDLNHNYAKLLEVESKTERGRIKKIFLFDEWELREEKIPLRSGIFEVLKTHVNGSSKSREMVRTGHIRCLNFSKAA